MKACPISGKTRFIVMLGDPISQVKTPTAFADWARSTSTDVVMIPIKVTAAGLATTLQSMREWENCLGAIVTYPHKQAAVPALDSNDEAVEIVGACNVIRRETDGRLSGTMTDGLGFVNALAGNHYSVEGRDVILVGAGGAGSAIALALVDAGAGRLVVIEIDTERRDALKTRLAQMRPRASVYSDIPEGFSCALVCNATPVGMNGDPMHPYTLDHLPTGCVVADIVPDPPQTAWLLEAVKRGHPVQSGPQMVAAQLPAITAFLLRATEDTPVGRMHRG
jgi:shikimate dehydrogenase